MIRLLSVLSAVCFLIPVARSDATLNSTTEWPIVGILTTPLQDSGDCVTLAQTMGLVDEKRRPHSGSGSVGSCFHNLYVEWLESAGARVVPILYDMSEEEVRHIFSSVNGVLFTGGDTYIKDTDSMYMRTAALLFNLTKEAYTNDEYVPLWGTLTLPSPPSLHSLTRIYSTLFSHRHHCHHRAAVTARARVL